MAIADIGEPAPSPIRFFSSTSQPVSGTLDEIRLWSRVRYATELKNEFRQRLMGKELGLAGYWRFDEATGSTIYDQTDNQVNGTISGIDNTAWVTSDAPIGENTGINRSSFQLATKTGDRHKLRSVESGLTALLYHQQEDVRSGYDGEKKPLKQSARVMLAVATKEADGTRNEIAALDFGVSREGMLAQIPDVVPLEMIQKPDDAGQSINDRLDALSDTQQTIRLINEDIINLDRAIKPLDQAINPLTNALENPPKFSLKIPDGRFSHLNNTLGDYQKVLATLSVAEKQAEDLKSELRRARGQVKAFQHANFLGASRFLNQRFFGIEDLERIGMLGNISSFRIPNAVQFVASNRDGFTRIFTSSVSFVGDELNDQISNIGIEEDPDFRAKITDAEQEVSTQEATRDRLITEITQARDELRNQHDALVAERQSKINELQTLTTAETELQNILKHGAEVPMGLVHVDGTGLSLSGSILGFAWTSDTPRLFDSAMGGL